MKTNSINAWPSDISHSTIAAYSSKTRRNRPGTANILPQPSPPDEDTIRRLNELAAKNPFCTTYKCKKHELL